MKVLQVNYSDRQGSRFTGFAHVEQFARTGVTLDFSVWNKQADNSYQLGSGMFRLFRKFPFKKVEHYLSIQSLLYPYSLQLSRTAQFRMADVVHYHLIHNGYFSILDLPRLTKLKPSVWTWHDPWPLTGHCIYPYDCRKWLNGCGDCPDLRCSMRMRRENTAFMWNLKKNLYKKSSFDVVVASRWMYDLVAKSPMSEFFTTHHIPFGIDLDIFRPGSGDRARSRLGIDPDAFVICFRAATQQAKGLPLILQALHKIQASRPICLLTFDKVGLLDEFRGRYQVVELGWVGDDNAMAAAFSASDVFLMPSAAEAFGMMAIEAMACGVPVVVCEGTALEGVIHAPQGGVSIPQGDAFRLAGEISTLAADEQRRRRLGESARAIVLSNYDVRDHVRKMSELYREVAAKRAADHDRIR